jgi:hypothetical protein
MMGIGMEAPRDDAAGPALVEVTVPFQDRPLVPVCPDRVRALRRHLIGAMRTLREVRRPERLARPLPPQPDGFGAEVVRTVCALCRGHCCKGGGTHAYLDETTLARVRAARPEADARAIMRLYASAVAPEAFEDSCVFHGRDGCTLPRTLRSDLCNSYHCNGLRDILHTSLSVRVTARHGGVVGGSVTLCPET